MENADKSKKRRLDDSKSNTSERSEAVVKLIPIVRDATIETFVKTIETYFELQRKADISTKLKMKREQEKINNKVSQTATESEKILN